MSDGNIKVLVRVRPFVAREDSARECLVAMAGATTTLRVPPALHLAGPSLRTFKFDESVWSHSRADAHFVDNEQFYRRTAPQLLAHLFDGFNVCFLAYGQTGLGKTHLMVGSDSEPGLIPRMVRDVLQRCEQLVARRTSCRVSLEYVEVHNEQVRDLLAAGARCRVREHPQTGPYVEGAAACAVTSFDAFMAQLDRGNRARLTAATQMNEQSSRLHAILTVTVVQTRFAGADGDGLGDVDEETTSTIKLVDLAGLERLSRTAARHHERVKEGNLINKSLTVLGRCINALATREAVVPYRDLVLTYLLRENLGGNSKTCMLFCVAPLDFEELLQTLTYANQVKRVRTAARANKKKIAPGLYDWSADGDAAAETLAQAAEAVAQAAEAERATKLARYLDHQLARVQFENRYMRARLAQRGAEAAETRSQLAYVSREVDAMVAAAESAAARLRAQTQRAAAALVLRCQRQQRLLEEELARFIPGANQAT